MRYFLILLILFINTGFAYQIHSSSQYNLSQEPGERILFILDCSNSMTEYLDGQRKIDLMIDTMTKLLLNIDKNTSVGLRVYGHKGGLTAFDACRASSLVVPIATENSHNLARALNRITPRGMTPITYSLKQAVKNDFMGYKGKKRIILLSDGGENCDESPCNYVMELIKTRKDIHIDVIAFNIKDKEDLSQLECTALVTSGKFYTANTASELIKSLNNSFGRKKYVDAKIIGNN